jgi:hypothetical protein
MAASPAQRLSPEVRGWLRHLWRKATTPDDWSRSGEPHPWWDRKSLEPMLSFPRFDLSESSYAFLLLARKTPAWREVYTRILDELLERHTTFWAAVDWLTQIGPDPDRARYPRRYKPLIPKDLWGRYDVPGWTANGIPPWKVEPDPIGSPGNLFFRGFFNLMLGIHRAVSGETTWDRPFAMAGLEYRTFSWTHRGIADYLSGQWAETPDGPHCENTKAWPFCLSAAGLGLQLADRTLGTSAHWVYERWVEDAFKKKFMTWDRRGNLRGVALYYDPLLERAHGNNRIFGLFPAIYVAPQDRALGELLYREAVASLGWDKRWMPILYPAKDPRGLTIAFLLAREYGDDTTARRLGKKLARMEGGRFFDGGGGSDADEFGYFFRYGEPWPRGQESALYLLKALLDGEGDWWRAFNEVDAEKHGAPTVTGCDYPRMGFAVAWNDAARGVLELESYAATSSARGEATRFRVERLPSAAGVRVLRDGAGYDAWRAVAEDAIEIETAIGDHRFEIATGWRGGAGARAAQPAGAGASVRPAGGAGARARTGPIEIATAVASVARAASACPCCAGVTA